MQYTIFDTPVVNTLFRLISLLILRLKGWQLSGQAPDAPRYVMIAAPHTSNWDFPYTLMIAFALRLKIYWMGKHTLFPFGFGWLMRWLGGIPINRSAAGDSVRGTIEAFQEAAKRDQPLVIAIPPEGTRSHVSHWKTGFYYIAHGAGVPIALGFLDFGRKVGGIGPLFTPSGDIDADMPQIRAFYQDKKGCNARQFNTDSIRRKD